MSNRDSLGFGDLLPHDVVEVFAQQKHHKRGRKKRSRSLRRAFSWLKGKKRKTLSSNGQGLGLGPALDLALDGHPAGQQGHKGAQKSGKQAHPQGNSHAVPKRDDDGKTPAPPLFQENVFIESSRPKYLEDLHTEAMEGLRMMQQDETNNGVEFRDNESTISAMTLQTDGEGGGFITDRTIPDSSSVVSMQSSASLRSSRSGLTRQGSTFRPLNSGKKSEKKTRRRHRRTVVGIPKHVQRELGLDRSGCSLTQTPDEEQPHNGEADVSSTTDGPQKTAESAKEMNTSLQATNIIQPLSKDKVEQLSATHAGHSDDLALLHRLGPDLESGQRPHSLAVPWMTTGSSLQLHPPSPVMSISPQAAYMSKIIPNAVLPPSIEVVEISRGPSRSSVRTVSKSSLQLSSPSPSRASSRASTRTTSSNITSASRFNVPDVSDCSFWSNSASSETLVSDSSTISSSGTPRQKRSQNEDSSVTDSKVMSSTCTSNGSSKSKIVKEDKVKKDGQFVRSLSVMKSKRAPPPPNRSYSLHGKAKGRSRDLAEVRVFPGESSPDKASALNSENEKNKLRSSPVPCVSIDSPGYNGDTSSLENSADSVLLSLIKSQQQSPEAKDVKNNAGTVSKEASQEKQEPLQGNKLNKMVSPSSGYSNQDGASPQISKQPHSSSPKQRKGFLAKLQRLFPGSSSPGSSPSSPSEPEFSEKTKITDIVDTVGVSPSVRTLRELFNIPAPPKVHAPPPPPPEVWAHNKRTFVLLFGPPAPDNTYAIIKKNPKDRRQQRQSSVSTEGSVKMERKHRNSTTTVESVNGSLDVLQTMKVHESGTLNTEMHRENNERLAQNGDLNVNGKDEKVRVCEMLNGMSVKAVEKCEETMVEVKREEGQHTSTQAAEVETNSDSLPSISLANISPLPPLQPLTTRQSTEAASVASVQVASPESSWPPPPPPMAQVGTSRPDEIDLPLPPPPLFGEEGLVLPSTAVSDEPEVKAGSVSVITVAEPKKLHTSNGVVSSTLNIPPPPHYTAPLPPTTAVLPPTTENISPPPPSLRPEKSTVPVVEDNTLQVTVAKEDPPTPVVEVSSRPPEDLSPPSQEASEYAEDAAPESKFKAPQSIPPPPQLPLQLHLSEQVDTPHDRTLLESETNAHPSNSILTPPKSIPPPPPSEPLQLTIHTQTADNPEAETPPSPPSEFRNSPSPKEAEESAPPPPISFPLPPPLPVQGLVNAKSRSSPVSTENQSQEQTSAPAEPTPIVTPLLLQMVKLRSVNSSPEPPEVQEETPAPVLLEEPGPIDTSSFPQTVNLQSVNSPDPPDAQEPPEPEVTVNQQQQRSQVPSSSSNSEVPQKPIRKSLIVPSTSTSPSVIVTLQPTLPKSETVVVPSEPSSATVSSVAKSPPATTPSMNLQEAIRLRTASRSKGSPLLGLQLPSSAPDFHKSPTSTASFIFSKSNKKVMIETKQEKENKESIQKKTEVSSVTKIPGEAESKNKGVKVPPPVAKKPKGNCKGVETNEGVEQTGQEAEEESVRVSDATEETNGTAGTVGGETLST